MTMYRVHNEGPWKGISSDNPAPGPLDELDDALNFFCRKARIHTRPKFIPNISPPDGGILRDVVTFKDAGGNMHTLALTTKTPYFLTSAGGNIAYNPLTLPSGTLEGTALPYGLARVLNRIYFSNGSRKIFYTDGEASVKDCNAIGSARFLSICAGYLLAAHCTEPEIGSPGSVSYPQQVRWSKEGDPDDWTDYSAGFERLFDVPDDITGMFASGRNNFVFRSNGITVMYPTGIALAPWEIDNMTTAPQGIGNAFPYSLAVYNNTACFVSLDGIYAQTGGNFQDLAAGKAEKAIYKDLADVSGDNVRGFMLPNLGTELPMLSYWLSIPSANPVTWVYLFKDQTWQRINSSLGRVTCLAQAVLA